MLGRRDFRVIARMVRMNTHKLLRSKKFLQLIHYFDDFFNFGPMSFRDVAQNFDFQLLDKKDSFVNSHVGLNFLN